VGFSIKMSRSSEICDVGVENKLGVVHPAKEEYAEEAIQALKAGKIIVVPTDTLYGFACDAWYVIPTGAFIDCLSPICLKSLEHYYGFLMSGIESVKFCI
jgi:hypothetical protein